jgi:WhiB family redox-sensing transcriptional regulator
VTAAARGRTSDKARPRRWAPTGTWAERGLCARSPNPDDWFPDEGDQAAVSEVKAICARCPVRSECLAYAVSHAEPFGVWGGLTERERRLLVVRGSGAA